MNANEVIEMYIEDTARLLPRRQRDDIAAELGALLRDELHARAQESGRPPDEALALAVVRSYGLPSEAAARYQPAWTIVAPADSKVFMRAALVGVGVLLLLYAFRQQLPGLPAITDDQVVVGILTWLGLLVLVFGVKGWLRRSRPSAAVWRPRDRNRVSRLGVAIAVPVASICVFFYSAPTWCLDRVSGGRLNTSWSLYTADFQQSRLPWCIGLWAGLLVLLSYVAIQGRWCRLTRRINIGLNIALALVVMRLAVDGNIFQSSAVDQLARNVLAGVAVIYLPGVGIMIFSEIGRIDRKVTRCLRGTQPE